MTMQDSVAGSSAPKTDDTGGILDEVEDAARFAIEDIEDSLDLLDDSQYAEALQKISEWCSDKLGKRSENIRNAGGCD